MSKWSAQGEACVLSPRVASRGASISPPHEASTGVPKASLFETPPKVVSSLLEDLEGFEDTEGFEGKEGFESSRAVEALSLGAASTCTKAVSELAAGSERKVCFLESREKSREQLRGGDSGASGDVIGRLYGE